MSKKKRLKNRKTNCSEIENITLVRDRSPIVPQRNKIDRTLNIVRRNDLTEKQKDFLKLALDSNTKIVFVSGPAGTGKSFLTVLAALELINSKKVSDLLYLRSIVESSSRSMGFLPGDVSLKVGVYLRPLTDKLEEFLSARDIKYLTEDSRISGEPINFLRGQNWNARVVIVDEAQNIDFCEHVTILSRIGKFSKVFVCGDPMQSDINSKSGFVPMYTLFDNEESRKEGIYVFNFTKDDIVRSGLVKYIIGVIEKYKKEKNNKI